MIYNAYILYIYIYLYLYHGIKQDRLRVWDTTRRWSHSWSLLSIPAGAGHGKDQGLSLPTKTGWWFGTFFHILGIVTPTD